MGRLPALKEAMADMGITEPASGADGSPDVAGASDHELRYEDYAEIELLQAPGPVPGDAVVVGQGETLGSPGTGMPNDLLLVRHGHSEGNLAREADKSGDSSLVNDQRFRERSTADWRLTATGRRQAKGAGVRIQQWMSDEGIASFDRYYSSSFARAVETAELLGLPGAQWRLEPLLRERDFGLWEGLGNAAVADLFDGSLKQKARNRFLWRPESGESTADLDLRLRAVLGTLAREVAGGTVVCVTHEDAMWALRQRLEKIPMDQFLTMIEDPLHQIENCSILHYTRRDEHGQLHDRFIRWQLMDPATPQRAEWHQIDRPRFSDDDLLEDLKAIEPLWPDH